MHEILRLTDSDEASLEARVSLAMLARGGDLAVSWFTLWYTTRPPVHHAVLRTTTPPEPLH
jgi:hypothetical protein